MYCICPAKTDTEVFLDNEVNWIVLEINEAVVKRLEKASLALSLVESAFERPMALTFYDVRPHFLHMVDELENEALFSWIEDLDRDGTYALVDNLPFDEAILEDNASSVERCRLRVDGCRSVEGEVMWEGYVKHTSIHFSSLFIKIEDLKAALSEKSAVTQEG